MVKKSSYENEWLTTSDWWLTLFGTVAHFRRSGGSLPSVRWLKVRRIIHVILF
jgi:hypothetical protein